MIAIPILRRLRSESGQGLRDKLAFWASGRAAIIALPLPFLLIQCVAGEGWPNGDQNLIGDMDNFAQHFLVFLYGCILCSSGSFWRGAEKNRLFFGIAGIVCFVATQIIEYSDAINVVRENPAAGVGWLILRAFGTWGLLLSILGYGKRHLNFTNRFLKYASEAALPFYIIHQTVIILIGYYVVQTQWNIAAKYLIVVVASFGGTALAYETLARRWAPMRFLFGMRAKK
jgi:peptidoglycan/LPS O-acetylase OafA/YrhL